MSTSIRHRPKALLGVCFPRKYPGRWTIIPIFCFLIAALPFFPIIVPPVMSHTDELFPGAPTLFGGINDSNRATLKGHHNLTGVAIRVISGEKPYSIPADVSGGLSPTFNDNQLLRFGISSDQPPPGSVVINQPESFFLNYRTLIAGTIIVVSILLALVIGLATSLLHLRRAKRELGESEERHSTLFTTMSLGVVCQDRRGRIISANPASLRILGLDERSIHGVSFHDPALQVIREDGTECPEDEHPSIRALRTGKEISSEVLGIFNRVKQDLVWISVSAVPLFERGQESPFQVYTVFEDITDKKRAEKTLREKELQYRLLAENTLDVIWQMDLDLRFTYVNQSIFRATQYTAAEWIGTRLSEYCDKETFQKMAQEASDLVSGRVEGPGIIFEAPMLKKNNQSFWAEIHARALFDNNGLPIGFQGVTRDITKRKDVEEKLRISENRFRTLLEAAPAGFWSTDPFGKNNYVNPYWTSLTGISRDEAQGDGWAGGLHPDDKARIFREWMDSSRRDKSYSSEFRFIHPDGRCVWVLCQALAVLKDDGSVSEWLGTITDITDRKRVEEALRHSEARYRAIFEGAAEGILVADQQTMSLKYANRTLCEMLGYSEDELIGLPVLSIHQINQLEYIMDDFVPNQQTSKAEQEAIKVTRKDGTVFYADIATTLIEIDGVMCNVEFLWDITQRIQAQESLRESESRYRAVVDNLQVGISVIDRNMEIVAINPFFGAYYTRVIPGIGQTCYSMYNHPAKSEPCSYCPCVLTFQDGQVHEVETETPTGNEIRNFRVISCPVKDEHEEVQLVIELVEDITERRSLHAQLTQAQKMEAVGTLAGGIAHDFNNILQVVAGYSELIQEDERLHEVLKADVIRINEAARRGAELVNRLLTFSRKTDFKPQSLDLNRRISDLRKMIERTIPKMIDIKLSLHESLFRINADMTQIDQVLMNLAVNARDAMPDGGRLTFETANIWIDADNPKLLSGNHPGQYVCLMVSDTGSGMNEETLSHIFEPFFTTKQPGKGTGLGLAAVHGIVMQHEAFIICESELGEGTSFKIFFPAIDTNVALEQPNIRISAIGGSETILLVDDDDVVRDICSRILEKAGYKVLNASDGREALKLYDALEDEISLVLLDLIMPEMSGKTCLEKLLLKNPSLKVIFISGYLGESTGSESLSEGVKAVIHKPFGRQDVLSVVRKVLKQ